MELGHHASFDKAASTSMQPLGFLDRLHAKPQHQSESEMGTRAVVADIDVDSREIYFFIMHFFLSAVPCQRTFTQFCNELMEYQLLPKRYHAFYSRNGEVTGDETDDGRPSHNAADVPTLLGVDPFSLLEGTENEVAADANKALAAYLR